MRHFSDRTVMKEANNVQHMSSSSPSKTHPSSFFGKEWHTGNYLLRPENWAREVTTVSADADADRTLPAQTPTEARRAKHQLYIYRPYI